MSLDAPLRRVSMPARTLYGCVRAPTIQAVYSYQSVEEILHRGIYPYYSILFVLSSFSRL